MGATADTPAKYQRAGCDLPRHRPAGVRWAVRSSAPGCEQRCSFISANPVWTEHGLHTLRFCGKCRNSSHGIPRTDDWPSDSAPFEFSRPRRPRISFCGLGYRSDAYRRRNGRWQANSADPHPNKFEQNAGDAIPTLVGPGEALGGVFLAER